MKRLFFSAIVLFLPALMYAQMGMPMGGGGMGMGMGMETPDPVRMWLDRPGLLVRKTVFPIGTVSDVNVTAMKMLDLNDGHTFDVVQLDRTTPLDRQINMQSQVVDTLLKQINMISTTVLSSKPENPTEIICRSMSGFEVRFLFDTKETNGKVWSVALQMKRDAKAGKEQYTYLDPAEFKTFVKLVTDARAKLD